MNLIRQRDDLKAACKAGAISQKQLEMALSSPVFQWWTGDKLGQVMSDTELEFIKANLMEEVPITLGDGQKGNTLWPLITPYECFRISNMDVEIYEQWWCHNERYTVFHCELHPTRKEKVWTLSAKSRHFMNGWGFGLWMDEVYAETDENDLMSPDREHEVKLKIGGRSYNITRGQLSMFSGDCVRRLSWFLFDIYGSGNTVVKVSPKPDVTKSVQWRQAREHYLVLRREHVEKLREHKGSVSDEEIVRAAHWRRAHLRRLSSGKFVNKRGLLVRVKKAWVGPTEWEGNDGKVYTVVGMEPPSLT